MKEVEKIQENSNHEIHKNQNLNADSNSKHRKSELSISKKLSQSLNSEEKKILLEKETILKHNQNNIDQAEQNELTKDLLNKEYSSDQKVKMTLLEETLQRIGYQKYQIICIVITLICVTSYGINLTIYASMVIPLKKFFELSNFEVSAISSILYVGTALGHLVTGFITRTYTRKQTVIFLICVISVLSLAIGFVTNKYLFALFRLLIGFGIGTLFPLLINTLSEYLPSYNKGIFLMVAFSGVYIGQLIPNLLMYEYIPEMDKTNVDKVQIIASFFSFTALIFAIWLYEDSPISLVVKKEYSRALVLIQKMDYKNSYTEEKRKMLMNEMIKNYSLEGKVKNLSSLFESKYRKSSILLVFIWFINSVLFFGPALIVSITIDKLGISFDKKTIISNQIMIILIGILGFYVGGFISEFKFLGRLRTKMVGLVLMVIFVSITMSYPDKFAILYGFAYACIPMYYYITVIYTSEFFPCRLRDLGIGFFYFINKVAGMVSQFLFMHLAQIDTNMPFYAIIAFSVLNIILISLMPYETLDEGMDFMEKID